MSDWIEWNGGEWGECPISPETAIVVKFRGGASYLEEGTYKTRAASWVWSHDGGEGDIIAYRVIGAAHD